jgi:hypothetical protein
LTLTGLRAGYGVLWTRPELGRDTAPGLTASRRVRNAILEVYPLQIAHKNDSPPGLAGQWLIECLVDQDDHVARFERV